MGFPNTRSLTCRLNRGWKYFLTRADLTENSFKHKKILSFFSMQWKSCCLLSTFFKIYFLCSAEELKPCRFGLINSHFWNNCSFTFKTSSCKIIFVYYIIVFSLNREIYYKTLYSAVLHQGVLILKYFWILLSCVQQLGVS